MTFNGWNLPSGFASVGSECESVVHRRSRQRAQARLQIIVVVEELTARTFCDLRQHIAGNCFPLPVHGVLSCDHAGLYARSVPAGNIGLSHHDGQSFRV